METTITGWIPRSIGDGIAGHRSLIERIRGTVALYSAGPPKWADSATPGLLEALADT